MSTPESKIVVAIETLLRGMPKASRDLAIFEKRLLALRNIKVGTQSISTAQFDKAALAAHRLQQQQQKLAIQSQELANRQERARQAADRLARSQQQLANQSARASRGLSQNADAHVRAFRAMETGARKAKSEVDKINAQTARQAREQQRIQEQAAKSIARVQTSAARQGADAIISSLNRSTGAAERFNALINRIGSSLGRIGSGLSGFGRQLTIALTAPLTAFAAISAKAATDIDDQTNSLKAFVGSAEAAEERLAELIATAQKTPGLTTNLGLVLDSQLRLANVTVETIDKVLPAIGRLNAVSKFQDPQRFAQNLSQLVTQNFERTDLKELVGQSPLAGQIIKEMFNVDSPINSEAIREAAQKMGLTTTEAFFAAFAQAASQNKALVNVTESISTRFAKIIDRVNVALRPLGLAIINAITPAIDAIVPLIERFGKAFAELPKSVQTGLIVLGAFAALIGPALIVMGGIVTALGGLVTGIGAIAGVIGAIGFPALLGVLAGVVIVLTELATIAVLIFKAWQTNFLGIREIVRDAATAIAVAFQRVRAVVNEITARILPTLESITNKVLTAVTRLWEQYGKKVLEVVKPAFEIILDVTTFFLRQFGDFIDLVVKLIDGNWKGAWQAFSRIVIGAIDNLPRILNKLNSIVIQAFVVLLRLVNSAAVRFAVAAQRIAVTFAVSLAAQLVQEAGRIRDALLDMFLTAALSFNPTSVAGVIVARFLAAMRRAASQPAPTSGTSGGEGPRVGGGADVGAGILRPKTPPGTPAPGDKQTRTLLDNLRQAQDEFAAAQAEGQLAILRAGIEQQFQLTKDGLERERQLLDANFEDRLVSVQKFFAEQRRLQEAEIDAEITRQKRLSGALADEFSNRTNQIEREFQTTLEDINRDPKLKGRSRELAVETAEQKKQTDLLKAQNDFENQNVSISTEILTLLEKRKGIGAAIAREAKNLTNELQRQQDQLTVDLLEEQGDASGAAALRLKAQFTETLKELRVDLKSLSPELQTALNDVDLSILKTKLDKLPEPVRLLIELLDIGITRAQIAENQLDVDRRLAELQLLSIDSQNKVLDGIISEKKGREEILSLQLRYKAVLLDILAAELARAESIGDQDEVLRVQRQIQEIQRLGKAFDEVGQQINRDVFSSIEDGFTGLFDNARRGLDGLRDAAVQFGESLLGILNRLAAQGLTEKLFGGILRPDATETEGTPGGFLSRIFGRAPKAAEGSALATAGTTAGTALTTGATAAATALTTGGATASASLVGGMTAAVASFTASVVAAGAAFAASVAAGAGAQTIGGLGSALGAATGMFPAVPGGAYKFVEGGYPEAVLTTDPKHASRQYQILKAYLAETKGLFGRIPKFAAGGFISPRQAEMDLLGSISRGPSPITAMPVATLAGAGRQSQSISLRNINLFDRKQMVSGYLRSAEGTRDILNVVSEQAGEIGRRIGVK